MNCCEVPSPPLQRIALLGPGRGVARRQRGARRPQLREQHRQGTQRAYQEPEGGGPDGRRPPAVLRGEGCRQGRGHRSDQRARSADSALIGIDFRVQDGQLYGVGNGGGVYTFIARRARPAWCQLTLRSTARTSFGVDFNPAADRLRIISDTGQNLRHNVSAGGTTTTDAPSPSWSVRAWSRPVVSPPPPTPTTTCRPLARPPAPRSMISRPWDRWWCSRRPTAFRVAAPPTWCRLGPCDPGRRRRGGGLRHLQRDLGGVSVDNLGYAVLNIGPTSAFYDLNFQTGQATLLDFFDDQVVDVALPV